MLTCYVSSFLEMLKESVPTFPLLLNVIFFKLFPCLPCSVIRDFSSSNKESYVYEGLNKGGIRLEFGIILRFFPLILCADG